MVDAVPSGAGALPVWLVTGYRRVARAPLIEALLAARPADQVWGVAASGLPLAIGDHPGLLTAILPAGCPCCTGTTPFQVGMTRLLRRLGETPVRRLIVESAEAAHVAQVRATFDTAAWASRVRVEATFAVLEAGDLAQAASRAAGAGAALAEAVDLAVVAPPAEAVARTFAATHPKVHVPAAWPEVTALARRLLDVTATA